MTAQAMLIMTLLAPFTKVSVGPIQMLLCTGWLAWLRVVMTLYLLRDV